MDRFRRSPCRIISLSYLVAARITVRQGATKMYAGTFSISSNWRACSTGAFGKSLDGGDVVDGHFRFRIPLWRLRKVVVCSRVVTISNSLSVPNGSAQTFYAGRDQPIKATLTSRIPVLALAPLINLTHVYGWRSYAQRLTMLHPNSTCSGLHALLPAGGGDVLRQ